MLPLAASAQERTEPLPFGNMDEWVTRQIKESGIIGGNTKKLYEPGPTQTIIKNEAYTPLGGSPWRTSNVYARVAGVTKTNTSVFPEARNGGYCARLETRFEKVKVFGLINIEVIAAGSMFLGEAIEPISSTKDPYRTILFGTPFTKKPKALRFDYKAKVMPEDFRLRATGFGRKDRIEGQDSISVVLLLQKRWEDAEGNIYARRVGTMVKRFAADTQDWVNGATFDVHYGDISDKPFFRHYMRLGEEGRNSKNSDGDIHPVQEVGWGTADDHPTHLILQFVSSHGGAYVGSVGNTLWVDNVELVY